MNDIITPERQKELYKEEKRSGTIVKEKKIGKMILVHVVQERNINIVVEDNLRLLDKRVQNLY